MAFTKERQKKAFIAPTKSYGDIEPTYVKDFSVDKPIKKATAYITSLGIYQGFINGKRIGQKLLTPGWTSYKRRQVQEYDVTELLDSSNHIEVTVGKGWYHTTFLFQRIGASHMQEPYMARPNALSFVLEILFADGETRWLLSDDTWKVCESPVRFSEIYDGEIYDARFENPEKREYQNAACYDLPEDTDLLMQEGEDIVMHERFPVAKIITTPKGETVLDFGQEITGHLVTKINAKEGEVVDVSFAEVFDKDGNFYNANYRSAKCQYHYTTKDGEQIYQPQFTFYGFRYVRINEFPGGVKNVNPENFEAVAVYSDIKRTGNIESSDPMLNQLFSNILWGQRDNFLDVPTDCPQRDERLGWTGDAQVFIRTAALNFDVHKFFKKWLTDLRLDQRADGLVECVIPSVRHRSSASAAWGDSATVCPWQIYISYGDKEILEDQFESMCLWLHYIESVTEKKDLWIGGGIQHYGDWLGLDAPSGSYKGSTRDDFIASAFYAYSTEIVIKAGKVIGRDMSSYEAQYARTIEAFRKEFPTCTTQTECVLALYFHLLPDEKAIAKQLNDRIKKIGYLETGFVGTPYLLHALSENGYTETAYELLLRKEYPSWFYSITKGATTIWEHWDSIMEDGSFWSTDMNSFNHYAYGSVADWIYMVALGIKTVEDAPGYAKIKIAPHPTKRLQYLKGSYDSINGRIESAWTWEGDKIRYDITVPVEATIEIGDTIEKVGPGTYTYYGTI